LLAAAFFVAGLISVDFAVCRFGGSNGERLALVLSVRFHDYDG